MPSRARDFPGPQARRPGHGFAPSAVAAPLAFGKLCQLTGDRRHI